MRGIRAKLGACLACAALALPGTAWAQSSIEGYAGPDGRVQAAVDEAAGGGAGGSAGGGAADSQVRALDVEDAGALPFTGLDLGLIGAGGLLLALTGVAMRRLTQAPTTR